LKKKFLSISFDPFFLWGVIPLALFILMIVFSHHFDWDHFFSAFEVDIRSWIIDKRPPIWSYQFCGGVSRWGDPQAFGLSPLFIFSIIFGSTYGPKLIIIISVILGLISTYLCLDLVEHWNEKIYKTLIPYKKLNFKLKSFWFFSLFFVVSQFFIWHFYVGHMTFSMFYWAVAIFYFTLKGLKFGLNKLEFIFATSLTAIFFSSGFYHATVYFLLPLLVSCIFILPKTKKKYFIQAFSFWAIGLILSSYKWLQVLKYHQNFPRVLEDIRETNDFWSTVAFHLSPTLNFDFLWPFEIKRFWFIWENTFFCVNTIIFIIVLLYILLKKKSAAIKHPVWKLIIFYIIISLLFSFGHFASWAPFPWINDTFFKSSIRTLSRFNILIPWACTLALPIFFKAIKSEKIKKSLLFIGYIVMIFSLSSQLKLLSYKEFSKYHYNNFIPIKKMRTVSIVKEWAHEQSYMYNPILAGLIVTNCYNPLSSKQVFKEYMKTLKDPRALKQKIFPLFDFPYSEANARCVRNSYVTQSNLVISDSCPEKICVNLNAMNIYKETQFRYNSTFKKLCNF